jgi:hypothetical protein
LSSTEEEKSCESGFLPLPGVKIGMIPGLFDLKICSLANKDKDLRTGTNFALINKEKN